MSFSNSLSELVSHLPCPRPCAPSKSLTRPASSASPVSRLTRLLLLPPVAEPGVVVRFCPPDFALVFAAGFFAAEAVIVFFLVLPVLLALDGLVPAVVVASLAPLAGVAVAALLDVRLRYCFLATALFESVFLAAVVVAAAGAAVALFFCAVFADTTFTFFFLTVAAFSFAAFVCFFFSALFGLAVFVLTGVVVVATVLVVVVVVLDGVLLTSFCGASPPFSVLLAGATRGDVFLSLFAEPGLFVVLFFGFLMTSAGAASALSFSFVSFVSSAVSVG